LLFWQFVDTDAGEASPLGRAELVKLYGLMFGVSKTATAIFDSIVVNYRDAMRIAASAKRRPSVMQGVPYAVRYLFAVLSCLTAGLMSRLSFL
jgi:iron complex transport system substrate-binding protein